MLNLKKLFSFAAFLMTASVAFCQQPLNVCCHPEDIKNWTPGSNPDDAFNVAKVPLQKRFREPALMKANSTQFYDGEICNSTILYPTCSLCPSQGELNNFLGYQPTYWQYMDKLVYWAGAASEGIINIPPASSTDAAHQSGVKSLGNIFFPPAAFGGTQAWVREMLVQENGKYVMAVKLYEMAKYYGFDGWFINEETGGGSQSEWEGFFRDFYAAAMADDPNTQMELQWYNASRSPNVGLLKTHINTSQFLEYGAVGSYTGYASQLNCTEAQTFSKIYAGVELAQSGHLGWTNALNSAMPTTGHVGSLDLFCPETKIWEDPAKKAFKSASDCHGTTAYPIGKTVFENDEDMWVNRNSDPTNPSASGFPGVSSRVLERSVITGMPFASDMGVGNGKHRFVQGKKEGTADWYHSGMQSILPTWRWWIENKSTLSVSIDWDNAFNSGSSFLFSGTLTAGDHLVRLYKTQIPVTAGGIFRIVYKTANAVSIEAQLSTQSSVTPDVTLQPATTTVGDWTVADFDLSSLNGKTVYMLAFNIKAAARVSSFKFNLARVAVLPAGYAPDAVEVRDLATTSVLGEERGDIRVTWKYDWNCDFDHFDIYTRTMDGVKNLVGQTRDEGFYIPRFDRNGDDQYVTVLVVPVMKDGLQRNASELKVSYPAPQAPKVSYSISPKSYVMVGETVNVTAQCTGHPTGYQWTLPEGVELASGTLTGQSVRVRAKEEGKVSLTLAATNAVGTTEYTAEAFDVFADAAAQNAVYNVLKGKTVVSYSGSTNSTEVPGKIIDGVTNPSQTSAKWCNISSDNEVVFDMEGAYRMYGFVIYDGNAGPESGVDQIDFYTIELSQDGKNWQTVVDNSTPGNEKISVKSDYIAPVKARYIRLRPHVNGTLRIWEFEAYGKEDNNLTMRVEPKQMSLMAGKTGNVTVYYDLGGDKREDYFVCTARTSGNTTIGNITEDKERQCFIVPVTAGYAYGVDNVTVTINNGGAYQERTLAVTIDSDTQPNILSGKTAQVRHYQADYSYEARYNTYSIQGLTDGDRQGEALLDIEDFSTHKRDLWAVFEAPTAEGWNLSKVNIFLPDGNYGENDNGNKGTVTKSVEICVGNDLTSMTTIHTFTDLDGISELSYILPEFRNTRYLAIVSTLNAYFYPSMAEVEAYEQYEDAIPLNAPVEIANWSDDVLAESRPATGSTDATLDKQGWCLFLPQVKATGALPVVDGQLTTKNGTVYAIDPAKKNSLVLKTVNAAKTLQFATPACCEEIYFIVISAEGTSSLKAVVNYEDGTSGAAQQFTIGDWFSGSANQGEAIYGLDRIKRGAGGGYTNDQFDGRSNFRIFEYTLSADKSKVVSGITFTSTASGKIPTILGVAKKGYRLIDPDGIGGIQDSESSASAAASSVYNLSGQRIGQMQKGVNIIRYTDGTARKVLVK